MVLFFDIGEVKKFMMWVKDKNYKIIEKYLIWKINELKIKVLVVFLLERIYKRMLIVIFEFGKFLYVYFVFILCIFFIVVGLLLDGRNYFVKDFNVLFLVKVFFDNGNKISEK